jgi:hypothetical protein
MQRGEPERARKRLEAALVICDRLGEGLYRNRIEGDLQELADSMPGAPLEL